MRTSIEAGLAAAERMNQSGNTQAAMRILEELADLWPDHPGPHRRLSLLYATIGQGREAILHASIASRLAPDSAALHCELGRLMAHAGQLQDALTEFRITSELAPDAVDGWFFSGITLNRLERPQAALPPLRQAYRIAPDQTAILRALADAEFSAGYPEDALPLWHRLCHQCPDDPTVHMRLGETLNRLDRPLDAVKTYRTALQHMPESAELWLALAQSEEDAGNRQEALVAYEHAASLRPGWALPVSGKIGVLRGNTPDDLMAEAEALRHAPALDDPGRALLGYALGKAYDARGENRVAMACWQDANQARRRSAGKLDIEKLDAGLHSQIAVFDRDFIDRNATRLGQPDTRPVFIVGMPRSGTTLAEQIISTHPAAHGCGELPDIALLANRWAVEYSTHDSPWPLCLERVSPAAAKLAADRYLQTASREAEQSASKLVDKAPLNFFHVGLISILFPRARIIWCQRDLMDVGLSIYSENFSPESTFATDLVDLGRFINRHRILMAHWQSVLSTPMTELRYESLVDQFERESRRLVEATGLRWDPACLEFHTNARGVQTPSKWQVRERIHSRSIGRWQKYREELALLEAELTKPLFRV